MRVWVRAAVLLSQQALLSRQVVLNTGWNVSDWDSCFGTGEDTGTSLPPGCTAGTQSRTVECSLTGIRCQPPAPESQRICGMGELCGYVLSAWGPCDSACGESGHEQRTASCVAQDLPGSCQPLTISLSRACIGNRGCNWWRSPWSSCSATCGGTGVQTRQISCLDMAGCDDPKPSTTQSCQGNTCEWNVGEWGDCTGSCGSAGLQHRTVSCPLSGLCADPEPAATQNCTVTHGCQQSTRRTTQQQLTETSRTTTTTRTSSSTTVMPAIPGFENDVNVFSWFASEWSSCSGACGTQKQRQREVYCVRTCSVYRCPKAATPRCGNPPPSGAGLVRPHSVEDCGIMAAPCPSTTTSTLTTIPSTTTTVPTTSSLRRLTTRRPTGNWECVFQGSLADCVQGATQCGAGCPCCRPATVDPVPTPSPASQGETQSDEARVVTTRLSSPAAAGSTAVSVAECENLATGMQFSISQGTYSETKTITSVNCNAGGRLLSRGSRRLRAGSITLDSALQHSYAAGATITAQTQATLVPQYLAPGGSSSDSSNSDIIWLVILIVVSIIATVILLGLGYGLCRAYFGKSKKSGLTEPEQLFTKRSSSKKDNLNQETFVREATEAWTEYEELRNAQRNEWFEEPPEVDAAQSPKSARSPQSKRQGSQKSSTFPEDFEETPLRKNSAGIHSVPPESPSAASRSSENSGRDAKMPRSKTQPAAARSSDSSNSKEQGSRAHARRSRTSASSSSAHPKGTAMPPRPNHSPNPRDSPPTRDRFSSSDKGTAKASPRRQSSGPEAKPQAKSEAKPEPKNAEANTPPKQNGDEGANASSETKTDADEHIEQVERGLSTTQAKDLEWRRQHFKSLLLKWHPDKNQDNTNRATEVFRYLMGRRARYLDA